MLVIHAEAMTAQLLGNIGAGAEKWAHFVSVGKGCAVWAPCGASSVLVITDFECRSCRVAVRLCVPGLALPEPALRLVDRFLQEGPAR